jgi:hypothetical protein
MVCLLGKVGRICGGKHNYSGPWNLALFLTHAEKKNYICTTRQSTYSKVHIYTGQTFVDTQGMFDEINADTLIVINTEIFVFFFVLYSTLLHLPPPQIPLCGRMLGTSPGLLRLWH